MRTSQYRYKDHSIKVIKDLRRLKRQVNRGLIQRKYEISNN